MWVPAKSDSRLMPFSPNSLATHMATCRCRETLRQRMQVAGPDGLRRIGEDEKRPMAAEDAMTARR